MPKQWYMEFVAGDWLADPAVTLLRLPTRAIWFDAICVMHGLDQCGQLSGTVDDLARLCRCTSNDMRLALDDLKNRNAADVTESHDNVTRIVTLTCRRMRRIWRDRNSMRERKKRQRDKEGHGDVTPDVTVDVTAPPYSYPYSHPPPSTGVGGGRARTKKEADLARLLAERRARKKPAEPPCPPENGRKPP